MLTLVSYEQCLHYYRYTDFNEMVKVLYQLTILLIGFTLEDVYRRLPKDDLRLLLKFLTNNAPSGA